MKAGGCCCCGVLTIINHCEVTLTPVIRNFADTATASIQDHQQHNNSQQHNTAHPIPPLMGTAGLTQQDAAAARLLTPTSRNEIKYGWVETLLEYGNYVYVYSFTTLLLLRFLLYSTYFYAFPYNVCTRWCCTLNQIHVDTKYRMKAVSRS